MKIDHTKSLNINKKFHYRKDINALFTNHKRETLTRKFSHNFRTRVNPQTPLFSTPSHTSTPLAPTYPTTRLHCRISPPRETATSPHKRP